ncbi:peptidylprolyl isomerase [Geodermatophilus sp. URMC 62]|uniref:peptidylprolyl isomerase n=1 Tax=Geodermatophilus sp. URMC 62 TaxID=3423414 RepID=UPI00406CC890
MPAEGTPAVPRGRGCCSAATPPAPERGGPTYAFPTDVDGSETCGRGTVAVADSGRGLDGSQFFLVRGDSALPPDHTVVGTVDDAGLAVLDAAAANGNDGSLDPSPGGGAPTVPVTVTAVTPAGGDAAPPGPAVPGGARGAGADSWR